MYRSLRALASTFAASLFCAYAYALPSDQDQPITVEADSVEIDDRTGISVYIGDVIVDQGSIHLTADKVTVYQIEKRTDKIVAIGKPVKFRQMTEAGEEVKGRAIQVEYHASRDELFLIGDAEIIQGKDRATSDRITYDRKKALVKAGAAAKGKERVRISIDPKTK